MKLKINWEKNEIIEKHAYDVIENFFLNWYLKLNSS